MFERIVTGLDIGTSSAKVVELWAGVRESKVRRCLEIPLEVHATPDESNESLRLALIRENVSLATVATAMESSRVTQRHVHFPFTGRQVPAALTLQIEDMIPVPLDTMVLTYEQRARRSPVQTDVLAILAPKVEVQKHLARAAALDVDPAVVEVDGVVLANAAALLGLGREPQLVLNIGHTTTNVVLLADGHPLLLRSIRVAGRHFDEAIASDLGIDLDTARKHKHEHGLLVPDGGRPATPRLATTLDQLAREISRSVQAIVSDALDASAPREIWLAGGSAAISGLAQYIEERTRLVCRPLAEVMAERAVAKPLVETGVPERFVQALGLAVRLSRAAVTRSDFRQGTFRFTGNQASRRQEIVRTVWLVTAVLLLWPVTLGWELLSLRSRADAIRERIAEVHGRILPESPVRGDPLESLERNASELDGLASHLGVTGAGASPLDLLREIHARIPATLEISIEELQIQRSSITGRAIAPDIPAIDLFRRELEKSPAVEQVATTDVKRLPGSGAARFRIQIQLRRAL
jgi:type IV pilus assembly protein PilM